MTLIVVAAVSNHPVGKRAGDGEDKEQACEAHDSNCNKAKWNPKDSEADGHARKANPGSDQEYAKQPAYDAER